MSPDPFTHLSSPGALRWFSFIKYRESTARGDGQSHAKTNAEEAVVGVRPAAVSGVSVSGSTPGKRTGTSDPREVTLLPRHWAWLAEQPGGASVTLRKLVEKARRAEGCVDRLPRIRDSAYRFMNAIAGNEPGFEEATRALFAGDATRFESCVEPWPNDVRSHALKLAGRAFNLAIFAGREIPGSSQ